MKNKLQNYLMMFTILFGLSPVMYGQYCTPSYSTACSFGDDLNDVYLQGATVTLSNLNSGCNGTAGYSDNTSMNVADLSAGLTYTLSVGTSYGSPQYESVKAWIDYNENDSFEANEIIAEISGLSSGLNDVDFTVPAGTALGVKRMRVKLDYTTNGAGIDPCASSVAYGETEDYNVDIIAPPSCIPVSNIDSVNVSTTSVELGWTENNGSSSWVIEYGVAGFSLGSGMQTSVATNPYLVSGLIPSTEYDFYVLTDCGSGDSSFWQGPYSTFTDCGVAVAPFYQSFDGTNETPQCWENTVNGGATAYNVWLFNNTPGYGAAANGKPAGSYVWADGSYENDSTMLTTTQIDLSQLTTPYLSFEWFSNNTDEPGDNVPLIVEVFDGTSWTLIDTLRGDSAEWVFVNYDLSAFMNDTVQVRFMVNQSVTNNFAFYNDILIDELRLDDCVSLGGQDGVFDICRLDSTVNLEDNIITKPNGGGYWSFPSQPAYLINDTVFNATYLQAGTYDVYYIERYVCYDTTVATINVYSPSSAGISSSDSVCQNEPINLFGILDGSVDLGGEWFDYSNIPLSGSQPNAPVIPGSYNYTYVVSNGVCPADTSIAEVIVSDDCDFLSIGLEEFSNISVYPNPTTNVLNIVNPSNATSLKVEMLDMNGRVVMSENKALENASEATIYIDHVERGVYSLRIYNEEGRKTFKIVKQ
ncbi:GEVED domain-containing protein [Brumimicrobium aurantiacum]|uniref:T9SS C-terminal target domain-containing protein n=1 Tax=Brumimicrobium aurantiacum TaxID=1737063 RepID=A0A3E1F0V8_9FLAO|nr:GEVED domain-containing protein [Brumimicrobium aurantiacum]RFC55461.1 T9SS C-terminal target domain-containing protein [Brumimicrobium aurantiacum]